jgi:hypothetical protein
MRAFRDAAESICMGEMVSRQIWSSQNWSLLPLQVIINLLLVYYFLFLGYDVYCFAATSFERLHDIANQFSGMAWQAVQSK